MNDGFARFLWGWAMRLAAPLLLLRWWARGAAEAGYRLHMKERLGLYGAPTESGRLWLHAVSLGETLAAAPLVQALREREPGLRLLFTHTTATGREAGAKLLRPGDAQCWLPIDTPGACQRFFDHWQPRAGILMETEVWPSLLFAAQRAEVEVTLANARLSERSLRKGQRFGSLLRGAAQRLHQALAQTEADALRLKAMGAASVQVAGNLKFDSKPPTDQVALGQRWRASTKRAVLLAAVTREGEEAMLLDAWRDWPSDTKPVLLVVPRHPQRFDEVEGLLQKAGLRVARRRQWSLGLPAKSADAWLGDSLGEMAAYYAAADLALLGGSFAPLGGQNLIQAASGGCPLLMGPHTFNFSDAAEGALQAGAAERVADMAEALRRAQDLMKNTPVRQAMAQAGVQFAAAHQGAAQRMAGAILA
ncbi:MAG: 3-deoxy-D-manno-octulosonic acid transferase [Inhella sp.]